MPHHPGGCRLAVRAGHTRDGKLRFRRTEDDARCQRSGAPAIFDDKLRNVYVADVTLDECGGRTLLCDRADEVVTVARRAFPRTEHHARGYVAAVVRNSGNADFGVA